MITAPPLSEITKVEDLALLVVDADERRQALLSDNRTDAVTYWTAMADLQHEIVEIYGRMMVLTAASTVHPLYVAARDAIQHWASQEALSRQSARNAARGMAERGRTGRA